MSVFRSTAASFAALSLAGAASIIGTAAPQASAAASDSTLRQSGDLYCCDALLPSDSPAVLELASLLGLVLPPATPVGVFCTGPGSNCATALVDCAGTDYLDGTLVMNCMQPSSGGSAAPE